jgi:hypothetical protein
MSFASADDSEELARAELYGLLSRLWLARPTTRCWRSSVSP